MKTPKKFNVVIVGQNGRLQYEAALFAASFRAANPAFKGRLIVAEPQLGPKWSGNPKMGDGEVRALLDRLKAEILPFESTHFGDSYPYGNKIEMLQALPKGEPFVFFDTDTLVLDDIAQVPFDFARPAQGRRNLATTGTLRAGLWPDLEIPLRPVRTRFRKFAGPLPTR